MPNIRCSLNQWGFQQGHKRKESPTWDSGEAMEDSDVKHAMLWDVSAQGLRMLNMKDYRGFVCVWTRFQRL